MIMGHDLMVNIRLISNFKYTVLGWDGALVNIKEPLHQTSKYNLSKLNTGQVMIHNIEPYPIRIIMIES